MSNVHNYRWPKRIRLERGLYEVPEQPISLTIACRNRHRYFESDALVEACRDSLQAVSEQHDVGVLAYCFMPDHLHLLVQPRSRSNVISFVQRYKSWTSRLAWQQDIHGKIWQPRFYDHILRESDDPMKQIRYIVENPVRAGLVGIWSDYPWVGSLEYDLTEFEW